MKLLEGKRALVTGVANRWSIATGIARKLHEYGAQIALTYQGERVHGSVEKIAAELEGDPFGRMRRAVRRIAGRGSRRSGRRFRTASTFSSIRLRMPTKKI